MNKNIDTKSLPKADFSPKGRELEHKIATEARRAIDKMDVSEQEKEEMKDMWFNYLLEYENQYKIYNKLFKKYGLPLPCQN